jgi:predicted Zn-dependent protease
MGRLSRPWICLALVALAAGACGVAPLIGRPDLWVQSEERERALDEAVHPGLTWQDGGPVQLDPPLHAYLARIVTALSDASDRPDLAVEFMLHSASAPTAWAVSRHTAMSRGLAESLQNEAQFAFIMAREIAHMATRHTPGRYTPALLGDRALGERRGRPGTRVAESHRSLSELVPGAEAIGGGRLRLTFDRGQELEADRLGVLYMARAGYDPAEAAQALEILGRSIERYRSGLGRPRAEQPVRHDVRVREIRGFLRQLPPSSGRLQGDGRFAERWLRHTAALRDLAPAYAAYDRARIAFNEDALPGAHRALATAMSRADQVQFWTLLGTLRIAEGRFQEAGVAFEHAIARYPGYQPAVHGLGVTAFAEGRHPSAIGYLQESLRLRPGFAPAEYVLGLSLATVGQHHAAIPNLRAAAESNPRHPEIHGTLARAYEETGQRQEAVAAWQAQLRVAADSALGREARRRLLAIATEPP